MLRAPYNLLEQHNWLSWIWANGSFDYFIPKAAH